MILSDFDGTITKKDTLVELLNTFAPAAWHEIERKVKSGKMGSRLALIKEFSLFYLTKKKYISFLRNSIKIDPAFKPFLKFIRNRKIKFIILSGGFSININTMLKKHRLGHIPFYSNRLIFKKNGFKIIYSHPADGCKKCGNCKRNHLLRYKKKGYYIIYIGDSTTDRCPIKEADIVFAKWELAEYCRSKKIPYIPYKTFKDVRDYLKTTY